MPVLHSNLAVTSQAWRKDRYENNSNLNYLAAISVEYSLPEDLM